MLLTAVDRLGGCGFDEPAYSNEHSFTQAQNSLVDFGIAELRRKTQWKDGLETEKQLMEAGTVLPGWKLRCFKSVGELLVGHERLFGFVGSRTDQGQPKIVGKKSDRVEQNALFAIAAGE